MPPRKKKAVEDLEIADNEEERPKKSRGRGRGRGGRTNTRKQLESDSDEKDEAEDDSDDEQINVGANDLMKLPIEQIRDELKRRNYHEGIVDHMPQWFLVSMLRDPGKPKEADYFSRYGIKDTKADKRSGQPIFATSQNDNRKEDSLEDVTNQKPEKAVKENEFNPEAYADQAETKQNESPPLSHGLKYRYGEDKDDLQLPEYTDPSIDGIILPDYLNKLASYFPKATINAFPESWKQTVKIAIEKKNGWKIEHIINLFVTPNLDENMNPKAEKDIILPDINNPPVEKKFSFIW